MAAATQSKGKIIVSGILFWYPLAGVTYQFLHYLIGLQRLGYDTYYVEDSGRWVYDPRINDLSPDAHGNIQMIAPVLEAYGFAGRWAFNGRYPGGECYGMDREQLARLYKEADGFLNVTGAQEIYDEHLLCPRRVYIESDPFAVQVKAAQQDRSTIATLAAHDLLFSFGENLGAPDCDVPVGDYRWLPTRQPVVLDLWNGAKGDPAAAYDTITTWHNKGKDIEYRGDTYYWTKDREFTRFLDLPRRRDVKFELAVTVDDEVNGLLTDHGWQQTSSLELSRDVSRYRDYIEHARAEFTVARDQYVRPRTGWFSDRSACYLAASRPVITQDTAFTKFLPTGKGLFAFTTMDEILAAIDEIERDYEGNCRAAREIAEEYFDAQRVIGRVMDRAGL